VTRDPSPPQGRLARTVAAGAGGLARPDEAGRFNPCGQDNKPCLRVPSY